MTQTFAAPGQPGMTVVRHSRHPMRRTAFVMLLLSTSAFAMVGVAAADPLVAAGCDFNNDGFEDLALGVPGENIGNVANAGAVNIIYGSATGLGAAGNQLWDQNSTAVEGVADSGDRFGAALACGNFNLDAYDDLAIGVPGEAIGGVANAGAVNVLFGSRAGLTASGNELWYQDGVLLTGTAEAGDRFGAALASGDFDDDVADDLAIGVPGEDFESAGHDNGGAVNVIYGGSSGFTAVGNQLWSQDSPSVVGATSGDEEFGAALASGDFDNDGFDDLAIGVPGEDVSLPDDESASDGGAINILNGSFSGLTADRDQLRTQASLAGAQEDGDHFGFSLAVGDFNNDNFDDLAVGVPGEDVGTNGSAGAVNVIYGGGGLLTVEGNTLWHQDSFLVPGSAERSDAFGAALAAADFNGDGRDDLAIGVPGEDLATIANTGAVNVLFGTNAGLLAVASQQWHQNSPSIAGLAETGNAFGSSLVAGQFDSDNRADLVVGVPGEAVGNVTSAGAVNVLYGSAGGPSGARDQIWHQDSPGILGGIEPFDRLGEQLLISNGVYRIPFINGTQVSVTGDHFSHSPDFNEYDMHGEPNSSGQQYFIVAAAAGTIMAIEDSNAEPTNSNNYVWIAHANGEWTKYTHFETGTVTALGRTVGQAVTAGTVLGLEGDVGQASGEHLHFEVAVPDDPANAISGGGFIIGHARVPLFCGVGGNVLFGGQTYSAKSC